MNTSGWKISLILGTDVFQKNVDKFRETSIRTIKDVKGIVVEVGSPGSKDCYTLMAKLLYFLWLIQ